MVGISKLYLGVAEESDSLRYGQERPAAGAPGNPGGAVRAAPAARPVVVWNATRACNLRCVHCYAAAGEIRAENELTPAQGIKLVEDLAAFGAPVLLFSGGEPMLRPDILETGRRAADLGVRAALSTNGTLITPGAAKRLKQAGFSYAGVSIDGSRDVHDRLRGMRGAFDMALAGLRACRDAGIKTGIRFTIFKDNAGQIPHIFELAGRENIPRLCFYHLVYAGRGAGLAAADLSTADTRRAMDVIIDGAAGLFNAGHRAEVLTVDNLCDGPYLYLRMMQEGNPQAGGALELLRAGARMAAGPRIACVNWDGAVYPDQFWRLHPLGNVCERAFGDIWDDPSNEFMAQLKRREAYLPDRCRRCGFLDICGGNFRARAEAATGDSWGFDPACYLTDKEVGVE